MMDFMLRTATRADMENALHVVGALEEAEIAPGEIELVSVAGYTVDMIGSIPARLDENGAIVVPADPRFHANLRAMVELTADQVAALPTFTPTPSIPYRVFI